MGSVFFGRIKYAMKIVFGVGVVPRVLFQVEDAVTHGHETCFVGFDWIMNSVTQVFVP